MLLFILPFTADTACNTDPECDAPTPWLSFTHIVLKVTWPGYSKQTEWSGSFDHETNDLLIDSRQLGTDDSTTGSIAMVGGRIMLSKGLDLESGYE